MTTQTHPSHIRKIVHALWSVGPNGMTRRQIARRTGLDFLIVTWALEEMYEDDVIEPAAIGARDVTWALSMSDDGDLFAEEMGLLQ
jgi:hypothetical protein